MSLKAHICFALNQLFIYYYFAMFIFSPVKVNEFSLIYAQDITALALKTFENKPANAFSLDNKTASIPSDCIPCFVHILC